MSKERDRFLLSRNPDARLSRRRVFARYADLERSALAASCRLQQASEDVSGDPAKKRWSLVDDERGSLSASETKHQGQHDDATAAPEARLGGTPGQNSGRRSSKSSQTSSRRQGPQILHNNRTPSEKSLPTASSLQDNLTLPLCCKKLVPASPREFERKGNCSGDDSEEALLRMKATREAFVARAKHYLGVLYRPGAKRRDGQQIGEGAYNDKLFLDCCGLVRQCVRDLKAEFGFEIGPWNQSYQMDTLPITVNADQMQPGDLIFVQGKYHDQKKRRPRHDIVHVEIFLGDSTGEASIGARNRSGAVDVFDTYKLQSSAYTVQAFHFRSLDTWLRGNCRPVAAFLQQGTRAGSGKMLKEDERNVNRGSHQSLANN